MGRKKFIKTTDYFYHVYNRSNQKVWYSCPMGKVWSIALNSLAKANTRYPVQIAQFVLMPNHYHMLVRTPQGNLDRFMYEFGKNFSLSLRLATNQINRMFSGRYKWTVVSNESYLQTIYRYIYQNPIRAKMVQRIDHYPYSTAHTKFTEGQISLFKIYENDDADNLLLNRTDLIARGLKKTHFAPIKSNE